MVEADGVVREGPKGVGSQLLLLLLLLLLLHLRAGKIFENTLLL